MILGDFLMLIMEGNRMGSIGGSGGGGNGECEVLEGWWEEDIVVDGEAGLWIIVDG